MVFYLFLDKMYLLYQENTINIFQDSIYSHTKWEKDLHNICLNIHNFHLEIFYFLLNIKILKQCLYIFNIFQDTRYSLLSQCLHKSHLYIHIIKKSLFCLILDMRYPRYHANMMCIFLGNKHNQIKWEKGLHNIYLNIHSHPLRIFYQLLSITILKLSQYMLNIFQDIRYNLWSQGLHKNHLSIHIIKKHLLCLVLGRLTLRQDLYRKNIFQDIKCN